MTGERRELKNLLIFFYLISAYVHVTKIRIFLKFTVQSVACATYNHNSVYTM